MTQTILIVDRIIWLTNLLASIENGKTKSRPLFAEKSDHSNSNRILLIHSISFLLHLLNISSCVMHGHDVSGMITFWPRNFQRIFSIAFSLQFEWRRYTSLILLHREPIFRRRLGNLNSLDFQTGSSFTFDHLREQREKYPHSLSYDSRPVFSKLVCWLFNSKFEEWPSQT